MALALGVTLYLQQLVDYGVEALGITRVAAAKNEAAELAGAYLAGRVALAVGVLTITALAAPFVLGREGQLLALYALTLFPIALSTRWVHLGLERARSVGISRVLGEAVAATLILAFVRSTESIRLVPLAQFIGDAVAVVWLLLRLTDHGLRVRLRWETSRIMEMAHSALPLVGHSILGLVIYNSDLIFLRLFGAPSDVGFYAVSYVLISFLGNLGWTYSQSLLPALTRLESEGGDPTKLFQTAQAQMFAATAPLALGGWLVARPLIASLFGPEYSEAGTALAVLIWSVPISLVRMVSLAALLSRERPDLVLRTTTGSAVANLALNVALIPKFGILGAAYATVITEALRATMALLLSHRLGYSGLVLQRLAPSLLAAAAMGAVVVALDSFNVWFRIGVGGLAYATALLATGGLRVRGGLRLSV